MRFAAVILVLPALAGCAGDVTDHARLMDAQTTFNNQDDNKCRSQGTTVGTGPYFQCREALAQEHIDEADAAREAQRQAAANPPTPQQPNLRSR
jgi:hypothetical protein